METIIGTSGTYYDYNVLLFFGIPIAIILIVGGIVSLEDYEYETLGWISLTIACLLILTIIILSIFKVYIFEYTEWYEVYVEEPSYINSLEFNKKYTIKEKKTENIYIVEKRE